jgi:hypothetical protein
MKSSLPATVLLDALRVTFEKLPRAGKMTDPSVGFLCCYPTTYQQTVRKQNWIDPPLPTNFQTIKLSDVAKGLAGNATQLDKWLEDKRKANGGKLEIHLYVGEWKSLKEFSPYATAARMKELREKRVWGKYMFYKWK